MNAIMNKTNTGKLLVAVLAMFMIVAGTAVVLGNEVNADGDSNAENGVASIGNQYYSTLDAAVKDATSGTAENPVEITLLNDAELSEFLENVVISADEKHTITLTTAIQIDGTVGLENIEIAVQGEISMAFYTGNYGGQKPINLTMNNVSFDESVNNNGDPSTVYLDRGSTVSIMGCDFTNTRLVYSGAEGANPAVTINNTTNVDMNVTSSNTVTVGKDIKIDGTSTIGDVRLAGGVAFTVPENVTFSAKSISLYVSSDGIASTGTIVTNNPSNIITDTPTEVPIENEDGLNIVTEVEDGVVYTDVIFSNVTVNPGVVIYVSGSCEISGDFRLFGTINNGNETTDDALTISVPKGATFTAYNGSSFGKNVYLDGAGKIDVSAAMQDFEVNKNVIGDYTYPQFQRVIITDTLTIMSGATMTVLGELVINEGVTLIIEAGATLQIGDSIITGGENDITAVGVTVNGTIEINDGATVNGTSYQKGVMDVVNAQNVTVNGEIVAAGELKVASNVTVKSGGTITVDDSDDAIITVGDDNNFVIEAGGVLNIYGQMDIASISNKGTITLYEAKVVGDTDSVIAMAADGATVNIESFTSNGNKLSIVDAGLIAGKDENKQNVIIGTTEGTKSNTISFTGDADQGLEGITIVESVTSETDGKKVTYTNTMYISGNVDVVDERQNVTESSAAAQYNINFNGASGIAVGTDESLVLGEGVVLNFWGGVLNVDGEVSAIDATVAVKNQQSEIYVSGTFLTADNALDDIMNAFHYSVKSTTTTDKHEVYTNLVNALANSQKIDYLGEVEILDNVTIPAETEIEANNGAKMVIGDGDHRDIIVTFANGSTFRNGGSLVIVNATLVAENYSKDLKNTDPQSDVIIDEGDKRTYTNIYTALDVDSGTVTIRQGATVFLDKDIEVKSGVTLVIPATTNLYMDNGVIMTVNGTIENSGTIDDKTLDPNGDYIDGATFAPEIAGEPNVDAPVIVVNGAFKSMTLTDYDAYYIPGAYYQIIDTEGAWYWITPVESAAAVAADAENGISIYGEVTVGDVAFTGTKGKTVVVTIMNGAEVSAGSVTLSRATIGFEEDGTGAFTGTIASAAGSIEFVNATGFTVDVDDVETTSITGTARKAVNDGADPTVTVATGSIVVDGVLNVNGVAFTIASGATVTVTGNGAELTTEGDAENDKLSVDGTLVATENGMVDVGTLTVRGTFNVLPADRDNGIDAGKMDVQTLYVGIAQDKDNANAYGDSSAASVTVDVTSRPGIIVVSAESTITGKLIEGMNSTEFFVEDALWITVYGTGTIAEYDVSAAKTVYGFIPADLAECKFNGWNDADGKLIVLTNGSIAVGAEKYKQVYANIDYNVYDVVITLDNTIGSVAIDGQMLIYQSGVGYVLPNGQKLTAGQHTVSYTLAANYEGTPVLSSQNVAVSGMTFTLSGDFEDQNIDGADKTIQYYLSLGGATLSDNTVIIEGGNGGNGELGLTDYLLIILVILIVIMAIIVAMRLMRS